MTDNLKIYNVLKQPPKEALKTIQAGRLRGMSDINPQWRYKIMTEQFGVCGIGWKYDIAKVWNEPIDDGQIFAFAEINLYTKDSEKWSDAIPAIGGSMLVSKESAGLHASDEGYKMAVTDALGTAMKMLGVAADIYAGLWDGTKYTNTESSKTPPKPKEEKPTEEPAEAPKPYSAWPHLPNVGSMLTRCSEYSIARTEAFSILNVTKATEISDCDEAWLVIAESKDIKLAE
uniref:Rad52/22 double-strand break repair protein n=1 Tax=viral metagenome TaxID=1070528 RepID=A0A6M3JT56_9ZZZZ